MNTRSVRFSEAQWALLRHLAKQRSLSISEFVRQTVGCAITLEGASTMLDRRGRWRPAPGEVGGDVVG